MEKKNKDNTFESGAAGVRLSAVFRQQYRQGRLESYLQHTADHFFDPHAHDGALEIYEYSGLRKELASHINSSCRRGLLPGGDRKGGHVSSGLLPAEFINRLEPKLYVPMNPTSEGYSGLFSQVRDIWGSNYPESRRTRISTACSPSGNTVI